MKFYKLLLLPLLSVLTAMLIGTPTAMLANVLGAALPAGDDARVTRVVSSDTIEVVIQNIGFTIGYLGVDAPHLATATARAQCYASQALTFNSRLVKGQTLRVEREVSDFDAGGRLLRWAFLPDGRLVNEELVKAGYAVASNVVPDHKYRDRLAVAQKAAQAAKLGMWGACTPAAVITPTVTAATTPGAQTSAATNAACPSANVCVVAPASGTSVYPGTIVVFKGMATATQHGFARYEFLAGKGAAWGFIADFKQPVVNGTLMEFHTETIPPGTYRIRLQVIDGTGNVSTEKAEIVLTIGWDAPSTLYTPVPGGSTNGGSSGGGDSCCMHCTVGKACGNSCIAAWKTCHKGPGCACNG